MHARRRSAGRLIKLSAEQLKTLLPFSPDRQRQRSKLDPVRPLGLKSDGKDGVCPLSLQQISAAWPQAALSEPSYQPHRLRWPRPRWVLFPFPRSPCFFIFYFLLLTKLWRRLFSINVMEFIIGFVFTFSMSHLFQNSNTAPEYPSRGTIKCNHWPK